MEPVVCARRPRILRALIAFSCRQQLIKYRLFTTNTSCFFNLCKVCLHKFVRFISKIARGACCLRSAIENTSCSHRLLLPSEISRQTSRRYGVPFFVCVPHTIAKTLQAGSSAAFKASSCQQFQPLHLPSSAQWFFIIGACRRKRCLFGFSTL